MEFVRLKYANNKLINANIQEHREVITDYVEKKGFEYLGFIPTSFGPNGKVLEVDLIFRKPVQKIARPVRHIVERPVQVAKSAPRSQSVQQSQPAPQPQPQKTVRRDTSKDSAKTAAVNDLYNDRALDLILNGGDSLGI